MLLSLKKIGKGKKKKAKNKTNNNKTKTATTYNSPCFRAQVEMLSFNSRNVQQVGTTSLLPHCHQ